MRNNLDFLTTHSDVDLNAIKEFEKKYRDQVGKRYQQITIPHFDKAPVIDIDEIFISPNFIYVPIKKGAEPETVSMEEFLARLYRVVLLGDPGGGKSTLSQRICYELCENYEKRTLSGRLITPVLVVLREYSVKKKQEGFSIVQFMESEVTSKYQLPRGAPSGAFEYLLNNGHLLVIFDGLDELLDPSYRREISADVESFCNLFPSVPVLVTSRIVGYEQAPLDPDRFETFRMAPFDDEQVSEYAGKWFANDPTLSVDESKRRAKAFLEESRMVSDLRSNPLMLALMCNLYRGAGFIPRNRPEVYKKCSEMLLERWDPSRGIWVHLPLPEPKFLISHLAHWIYSNEPLQSGVSSSVLINESAKFLLQRRFESWEEAEKASREFLEFCRGRAWVFTDAGITPSGEPLYRFTHKTFLEYFTAVNIVRNNSTPEKLWKLLGPEIAKRSWDVVAQLSFQMLHEQVEGASDEILMLLIQDSQKKIASRWAYLSFGARCLQFIYPSPKTLRVLTKAAIRCVIKRATLSHRREILWRRSPGGEAEELIGALLLAAPECRPTVADAIESEIVNYSKIANDKIALLAIDLGLMLGVSLQFREYPVEPDQREYWEAVVKKIFEQVDERLYCLARYDFLAFMLWFSRHDMPVEKVFEWYTPDHLFLRQGHPVFENLFYMPIAEVILRSVGFDIPVHAEFSQVLERRTKAAAEIGKILLSRQLPCFSYGAVQSMSEQRIEPYFVSGGIGMLATLGQLGPKVTVPTSGDAIIGLWCLWAAFAEVTKKPEELISDLKNLGSPVIKAISDTIEVRIHETASDNALGVFGRFNLSGTALQFVERWMAVQLSFVQPSVVGGLKFSGNKSEI